MLWLASFATSAADPATAQKLREGGYVLYMRHASTDFSKNDASMKGWEDCANQRPLTDKGRDEAREVAAQLRRLSIPIGEVLASPFCRTLETARLAFGKATVMHEVRGGPLRSDDPARYDALKKLMSSKVEKGSNRVISSHGNPFRAITESPYLAEGEIAVVRPEGNGRFTVIDRIRLEEWKALPAAAGRAS